ncbi:glycoside hydrolase family 3 N-terminal domain-containing protein [Amycolatopsis kentuckyensis]|uniref:glycoside hydrolase family 3 N-terminal domain-containing protein n=1 Tax=Amycolatopsis kentuckyensis TaxID=218823 RepID=UPI001FC9C1B1|nr:glycoside hydrolase family 3 N-terminal domain-containing protein [Amycolatopsis kentuckyensis]
MTLAEKIGQLQLVGDETAALADGRLGGVFSVVGAAKLSALQRIAVMRTRLGIPLIFGLDVIHGDTTNFPIPLAQGASFDPAVAGTDAGVSAGEARGSGIQTNYTSHDNLSAVRTHLLSRSTQAAPITGPAVVTPEPPEPLFPELAETGDEAPS